ncbi:MAG TPA: glutathione-regulated potassium-efflux system oxidoreductase KefF [Usitatibacter sp.]|nr:glutathione-regulated potassium-efflux system oxidoreductase KefF [Usitatibacter sp.]
MIVVIFAHPYPRHSRACAALLGAIGELPDLHVRSLYDLYPDFDVDAQAERAALEAADLVIWMHPLYWYSAPSLLKLWFEQVLTKGWAYGQGGAALAGKECLWVTTTGGDEKAYTQLGKHQHSFAAFVPVIEETARFCGMRWLEPFVVHGAHLVTDEALREIAARLRARLDAWASARGSP